MDVCEWTSLQITGIGIFISIAEYRPPISRQGRTSSDADTGWRCNCPHAGITSEVFNNIRNIFNFKPLKQVFTINSQVVGLGLLLP